VRNVCYVAFCCCVLAASGCNSGSHMQMAEVGTESRDDARFGAALAGLDSPRMVSDFLKGCSPQDKVKYINKTVEFGPVMMYRLKGVYEQYASDPSPEVAAAAKEALEKVPNEEDYKKALADQVEKLKTPQ
jgi:hypothetical protein